MLQAAAERYRHEAQARQAERSGHPAPAVPSLPTSSEPLSQPASSSLVLRPGGSRGAAACSGVRRPPAPSLMPPRPPARAPSLALELALENPAERAFCAIEFKLVGELHSAWRPVVRMQQHCQTAAQCTAPPQEPGSRAARKVRERRAEGRPPCNPRLAAMPMSRCNRARSFPASCQSCQAQHAEGSTQPIAAA